VSIEPEEAPEVREQGFFFKLVGGISRWGAYLGGVTLIVITAIVTYDVFARFLGHPTDWATEVAGYMVIGVAVLGAADAAGRAGGRACVLQVLALPDARGSPG